MSHFWNNHQVTLQSWLKQFTATFFFWLKSELLRFSPIARRRWRRDSLSLLESQIVSNELLMLARAIYINICHSQQTSKRTEVLWKNAAYARKMKQGKGIGLTYWSEQVWNRIPNFAEISIEFSNQWKRLPVCSTTLLQCVWLPSKLWNTFTVSQL